MEALYIGSRREVFWDNYLVNVQKTTAARRLGMPVRRETVLRFDEPWEGDGCNYQNIVCDQGVYRMYYLGYCFLLEEKPLKTSEIRVCYAESKDGIHWVKPKLGIVEVDGSKENNVILDRQMMGLSFIDNFYVMIDDNPNRTIPERYKAIASKWEVWKDGEWARRSLMSYVSDDGLHFRCGGMVTDKGFFDSLNTVHWNEVLGKYLCYIRGFHLFDDYGKLVDADNTDNHAVRDIRVIESEDFVHWSDPVLLEYSSNTDYPLYTNAIIPYFRAQHIMTGFPTRYVERREWTRAFDRLCGAEKRRKRCEINTRLGLAVTDALFMSSRDGYEWNRFDEAFIRPEPENGRNWVYGDAYPTVGLVPTLSGQEGADEEISMYLNENHWMGSPTELARYTIRLDGFASLYAGIEPKKIVTKLFVFSGSALEINFATSALGYVRITLSCPETGGRIDSDDLFGNSTGRIVDFDGEMAAFAGKSVVMSMELCDADIYSFRFF